MPYNGFGNFTLVPTYFVQNGDDVLPSQHNPPLEDIGAGMSSVLVKDGRAPMTGDLKMGGFKVTGASDGVADTDLATVGQGTLRVGDYLDTLRNPGAKFLRRNGAIYNSSSYPVLSQLLPALPDGVSWRTISIAESNIRCIIYTPEGYFLGAPSGTGSRVYNSTDAETWSLVATIPNFFITSMAYGAGIYVAADGLAGKAVTSLNGTAWGSPIFAIGSGSDYVLDVAFGGGIFVAVGSNGKISTTNDGATWTARTSGTTSVFSGVDFANGNFIAVGTGGVIVTSSNAASWTPQASGVTKDLRAAVFGAGIYVVVGTDGEIVTSPNLSTWTHRNSGTAQGLETVIYSSSGFLAAGNGGTAVISATGTTWAISPTGTPASFQDAAANPGIPSEYIVVGTALLKGTRTLATQFRVPDDDAAKGWIKAL